MLGQGSPPPLSCYNPKESHLRLFSVFFSVFELSLKKPQKIGTSRTPPSLGNHPNFIGPKDHFLRVFYLFSTPGTECCFGHVCQTGKKYDPLVEHRIWSKNYTTKIFSISSLWIFWRTFIYSRLWNHRKFSPVWSQGAAVEQQLLLVLQQSSLPPWWVENFNLWVMWRHELSERQFLLGMNGTSKMDRFLEKGQPALELPPPRSFVDF